MGTKEDAENAVEIIKGFLKKEDYKGARTLLKKAMELYPDLGNGLEMLIVCETLYYANMDFPKCGIDWYSVLHLNPWDNNAKIRTQCEKITSSITVMKGLGFPGAVDALHFVDCAIYVLCNDAKRREYDLRRKDSGLMALPDSIKKNRFPGRPTFHKLYLDWQPPVFNTDVADHLESRKRPSVSTFALQYEVDGEPSLSLHRQKLKKRMFDAMPQAPHFCPLLKYTKKIREGMMLALDDVFVNVAEEIQQLKEPQSFSSELDGLMEQLKQLEEMGYNVEKPMQRLVTLSGLAKCYLDSHKTKKQFEEEIKCHEAKINQFKARILEIEAAVEDSKHCVDNRNGKIDALNKQLAEAVDAFQSTAKAKWD